MKSNQYVYPSLPYKNLNNHKIFDNITGAKTVGFSHIKKIIGSIRYEKVNYRGKNSAEKIFNIFLNSAIIFGPNDYISSHRNMWMEKINYFVEKKKPLQFTLLGFPFKMAVSLKTNRILPDMGELLALARLNELYKIIKKVYKPGIIINIFTEGGFGKFSGISERDWKKYHSELVKYCRKLGWNGHIKIRALADMEKEKNFASVFSGNKANFEKLYSEKDVDFLKKYDGTFGPVYRLVRSDMYSTEKLLDVYNDDISDIKLDEIARKARREIRQRTEQCIFSYFSYLKTRDDIHYLEKVVPHYLALTVSPKPGRLGIIPIFRHVSILPYHGVTVFNNQKNKWDIKYLIDISRDRLKKYTPVHLEKDSDPAPFYFLEK